MKTATSFFVFFLLYLPVMSQENLEIKQEKNQVNFYATDLINGLYTISYERSVGKRIAVNLGFGVKSEDGLIRLSGIDRDQLKTNDITYSGFKFFPEFKYYFHESKVGTMHSGFYFGSYLKYSDLKSDLVGTFIGSDVDKTEYNISYKGNIKVTSIGLMVGYKLPVAKHLYIDFLIAGPGSGSYKFDLKTTETPPDEFYDVLNKALDEYSLFDLINADFRFKDSNSRSNFSVLSFRYGISVGYSF